VGLMVPGPAGKIMEVPGFAEELVCYGPPFLPLSRRRAPGPQVRMAAASAPLADGAGWPTVPGVSLFQGRLQ
jgi:hypothetical protein